MLTAREQVDRVDGIVRRLYADEPGRNLDVLRPDQVLDDVHRFHFDQLGALQARAGRRTQAELQLPGFHCRKDFRADTREEDVNQRS